MSAKEIKFMFDGIIFSSQVLTNRVLESLNRYEFSISFANQYLISKYRDGYYFVFENNNFKPVYAKDEKENELIKILQETIMKALW